MADSSFDQFHHHSSASSHRHRRPSRHHPTPASSNYPSASFTQLSSQYSPAWRRHNHHPKTPAATPFASDKDVSWQGEVSWQFEPTGWQESHNFGAVLSPWSITTAFPSESNRLASDYYLSRTSNGQSRTSNNPYHDQSFSDYGVTNQGRIELQSFVGRDNKNSSFHGKFHARHGLQKLVKKEEPLANQDELSIIDDDTPEDEGHHQHHHHHYNLHGHDHHRYNDAWPSSSRQYHGGDDPYYNDVDRGSFEIGEEEEEDDDGDEDGATKSVGLFSLFKYSTKWDFVLIVLGCLGALINGGSLPWYSFLFGKFVNKIALDFSRSDKTQMMKDVEQVSLFLSF